MDENFTLTNTTKSTLPSVPFLAIKEAIVGKKYSLSLVFVGNKKSQQLNNTYRSKNKPTNILSFELSKNEGEIFIAPAVARKEAHLFDKNFDDFIALLFIHGLLHLKGMEHGSTMEKSERKFLKKFSL